MTTYFEIEGAADAAMDQMDSCRCCLWGAADRDLTTPYTHLDKTETYLDMFKECFDLHLAVGGDGSCGICSACAGRLRDARDFKLQVQRCQTELQARLRGAELIGKTESLNAGAGEMLYEVAVEKLEVPEYTLDNPVLLAAPGLAGRATLAEEQSPATHESGRASRVKETHDNTAGRSAEEAYICDTCGKHFTGKSRLIAHVQKQHGENESAATYYCVTCSEPFPSEYLLAKHMQAHSDKDKSNVTKYLRAYMIIDRRNANNCKIIMGKRPAVKLDELDDTESLKCNLCNKQFRHGSNLSRHKRTHNGEKPYKCEECNKRFTQKGSLDEHKRLHTGEKKYNCAECNQQFTHRSLFNTHIILHTEKPYKCEECNKRFAQKGSLDAHKRIHSGEKPYRCDECNKQFTQKCNLDAHKRIHTGEKIYRCGECNQQFTDKSQFNMHIIIHTGKKLHACDVCNKLFTRKSCLDDHKVVHTGEKPFSCEVCNKRFT